MDTYIGRLRLCFLHIITQHWPWCHLLQVTLLTTPEITPHLCHQLVLTVRYLINPLTPNDPYSGRTAPLTSKRCILYIYSTNTGTEYFKDGIYCPFFLFKMQFVS